MFYFILRCTEFKQIFAIQNEWPHFIYIDLFRKLPLTMFSVPRIAAVPDNWNMLLCTMQNESKTGAEPWRAGLLLVSFTEPTRRLLTWLLQFPSSLLWFAVTQEVRMAHAFGVPTTMSILVSQNSKFLSLITLKGKVSGVKWITKVWRWIREWA